MIYWFGSDMTSEESDGSLFDKEAYNSDSINQDGFEIDTILLNSPKISKMSLQRTIDPGRLRSELCPWRVKQPLSISKRA